LTRFTSQFALAVLADVQGMTPPPGALSASLTLGWRALLKIKHVPTQLVDAIIFPILITLMFTYVFGGAVAGSVEAYLQRLIPGILVMTIAMSSSYTASGLNTDIAKGIFDRFRSLPFWRPAVIVGSLLGDTVRYMTTALVVIVLSLILGFRPEAGLSGVLLSPGLSLVFAFSLSWIWTAVGLLMDDAESVQIMSQVVTFPLLFISNVFVDPATIELRVRGFSGEMDVAIERASIAQCSRVFIWLPILIKYSRKFP
jgi:ABC-2 type transport system permease protein